MDRAANKICIATPTEERIDLRSQQKEGRKEEMKDENNNAPLASRRGIGKNRKVFLCENAFNSPLISGTQLKEPVCCQP